ncbi:MAG TPA: hypothetical protein EYQ43_05245 [Methyloprofundus sp.]|uniref:hypothetical protein n=1 Tax=Methyloprofundus sp. TaxID=2020875 RepID=UPI0017D3E3E0|nr:hypothetical protein [Methyloprofundus sp.]HIG64959.1 hypothetical protein [Methyloprofundus sp.]HIL79121.1 hypothetical protein [Methylococcales bacterium]
MSEVLSIKDLICAYWGLLPTVFILLIIGMLKLPYIKNLWRNQGYDTQPVGNSELRITPEQRVKFNCVLSEIHVEINDFIYAIEDIKQGRNSIETLAKYLSKTNNDIEALFTKINELNKDLHSDKIRYINNHWEQMQFTSVLLDPARLCPHRNRYIS